MISCPNCGCWLGKEDKNCGQCHFVIPTGLRKKASRKTGLAYSALADFALAVSSFMALLGCVVTVAYTVISLSNGQVQIGLVFGPISFFLQLGLWVVFTRVRNMN